jgi:hemerythrin-like domain-containing protein
MVRAAEQSATESTSGKAIDAVKLLKQDHREVEDLFEQFEEAEQDEQGELAERVCQLLTVHAQIEEEILYPAAKEAFQDEEEEDMVYEAVVEHASAKDLIAKIEAMTPEDESFKATVKVLSEYIKHHVKEEETEMFPSLKDTDLDLKAIGTQLYERKLELMEELGIEPSEEEEEEPSSRSKSGGKSKAKSGGKKSKH